MSFKCVTVTGTYLGARHQETFNERIIRNL